jgi:hypothetical protein
MILSLVLVLVPVLNEKYSKLTRLARALKEDRANFVLVGMGATLTFLLAYVVSITPNNSLLNIAKFYQLDFSLDTGWLQEPNERSTCQGTW